MTPHMSRGIIEQVLKNPVDLDTGDHSQFATVACRGEV